MSDYYRALDAHAYAVHEAQQDAHDALRATLRQGNRAALFDALAASGITAVTVCFDGAGDSGQVESIDAVAGDQPCELPAAEEPVAVARWGEAEPEHARRPLRDAIEDLAYDLLAERYEGWENGDGAYGEFTFDVGARTITLAFNQRVVTSEYHECRF